MFGAGEGHNLRVLDSSRTPKHISAKTCFSSGFCCFNLYFISALIFHFRRFLNFNLIFCVSKLTKVCFRLCSEHGNLCEPHEMVVNGGGQTYHAFLYVSLLNCDLAGFMLDVLELS